MKKFTKVILCLTLVVFVGYLGMKEAKTFEEYYVSFKASDTLVEKKVSLVGMLIKAETFDNNLVFCMCATKGGILKGFGLKRLRKQAETINAFENWVKYCAVVEEREDAIFAICAMYMTVENEIQLAIANAIVPDEIKPLIAEILIETHNELVRKGLIPKPTSGDKTTTTSTKFQINQTKLVSKTLMPTGQGDVS